MIRPLLLAAALIAAPATADVVQSSPIGFEIRNTVTVSATVERAWPVVVAPRLWWDKDHTYSENSANLTLDERAGGCFCEKLPNQGGVEHMRVVYIQPPLMVRMVGALGPLQAEAADGTMSIELAREGTNTKITMTYVAGGYVRAGADKLAPVVERVLAQQLAGLKAAIEGGNAVSAPAGAPSKPGRATKPAATPRASADPLADVGQTISGFSGEGQPAPDASPPKPRPADQDSPR